MLSQISDKKIEKVLKKQNKESANYQNLMKEWTHSYTLVQSSAGYFYKLINGYV